MLVLYLDLRSYRIFKQADRNQLGASKKRKKKKQSFIRPHVTISNQFNLTQKPS